MEVSMSAEIQVKANRWDAISTSEDWRTRQDFFNNNFHPEVVYRKRNSRRVSTLLAAHALFRAASVLEGLQRQKAELAIKEACRLAEANANPLLVRKYCKQFNDLSRAGYNYGLAMDNMQTWEIRLLGGPNPKFEMLCGIWQLLRILEGRCLVRWKALISARQALISNAGDSYRHSARQAERLYQTNLVRDIFPDPFLPRTHFSLRHWVANRKISRMAKAIYDQKQFSDMPALADVLEKAGCACHEAIDHCRTGSFHVRGCWVLDKLLGKK